MDERFERFNTRTLVLCLIVGIILNFGSLLFGFDFRGAVLAYGWSLLSGILPVALAFLFVKKNRWPIVYWCLALPSLSLIWLVWSISGERDKASEAN